VSRPEMRLRSAERNEVIIGSGNVTRAHYRFYRQQRASPFAADRRARQPKWQFHDQRNLSEAD